MGVPDTAVADSCADPGHALTLKSRATFNPKGNPSPEKMGLPQWAPVTFHRHLTESKKKKAGRQVPRTPEDFLPHSLPPPPPEPSSFYLEGNPILSTGGPKNSAWRGQPRFPGLLEGPATLS